MKARKDVVAVYDAQEKMYATDQLGQIHFTARALKLAENMSERWNSDEEKRIRERDSNTAIGEGRVLNTSVHEKALLKKRNTLEELQVCCTIRLKGHDCVA